MRRLLLSATIAAVTLIGRAQTPPVQPGPPPTPHLSEVEKLKIENLQLKFTQLTQQMQQAQTEQQKLGQQYQALLADIEKEHPGFTVGQSGDLIPKPAPAAPKVEAKPEVKK
jgi:hypothetical protein